MQTLPIYWRLFSHVSFVPEVFKVRKDAETALAAANKLISAGDRTFKNQKTKTMKRIEVLEAELAKLRVSMVDDH